ncbi:putative rna helicase hel117 [Diaporthe ampelina]|uniref:Putative rna helicase hel117 n=1 Tax=Diaporthe ampelina TaxID=1214573 RepID=A0A0G2I005_9PEZI|nr:putative rna helicase hel117 [Diaporthe ampelina]
MRSTDQRNSPEANRTNPPPRLKINDEDRKRHRHHHRRHRTKPAAAAASAARETPASLPSNARPLSYKHDLDAFTPLFAYYLDVQKSLDLYELDPQQARGRWKSFVNKWNRGELAEGWYDPEMFGRITREFPAPPPAARTSAAARQDGARGGYGAVEEGGGERERGRGRSTPSDGARTQLADDDDDDARRPVNRNDSDSDSDYGPPPPPGQSDLAASGARKGPGMPTLSDLALQREAAAEERDGQLDDLRRARRADRARQKERLEELAPRAEPGTRERRLEKKALVNEKMAGFREGAGGVEEVGDGDLMGGGDSVAELKRAKAAMQRKKTERELRREAEARAREEERLERLREWREREEEKLRGLKELARARFG